MSFRQVIIHLWQSFQLSVNIKELRRLILESMAFEGMFKVAKDYLQPILKAMALGVPIFLGVEEIRRSAVMVGVVYLLLYLCSAYASRKSHILAKYVGGENKAIALLWKTVLVIYLVLVPLLYLQWYYLVVIGFIGLYVIQNFWRPMQISRFDEYATESQGATVLSIENQAKVLVTMVVAPALGFAVDWMKAQGGGGEFWPVAVAGAIAAALVIFSGRRNKLASC